MSKKRVLIRAPLLTMSGYGVHARQIFEWAIERPDFEVFVQPLPWGLTPWILGDNEKSGLAGEIVRRNVDVSSLKQRFDITIQVQLPNEWDASLGNFNIGITAAVETDTCSKDWIYACNKMSAVIVPSKHTKSVLTNSGVNLAVPIFVVPESYHSSIDSDDLPSVDLDLKTDFNFLVFGQITGNNPENDRKNLFYTIKWICEEFRNDENVGLIIKTNAGRSSKIDRVMTEKILKKLLAQVRGDNPSPRTYLLHGNLSEEEVASVYRDKKVKALVSLTRGEGFGLPLGEAAASGLPVIATGWSGHTDFLSHGKYISLEPHLKPIHKTRIDNKIFIEGAKWAEVDEKEVKQKLRKFYERPINPKQWATELSETIKNKYCIKNIKLLYDEAFAKLGVTNG